MATNNDGLFTWSRSPVNDFKKGLHRNSKYNDPTYLGFVLLFDWTTPLTQSGTGGSPLLAGRINEASAGSDPESWNTKPGTAMDYLKRCGEFKRMRYLNAFINSLHSINYKMPWYWQSIEGLNEAWKLNNMSDPYVGGDESNIKITTLESIDLIMTKCIDLYKHAVYDWRNKRVIIPENLRKFTLYIHVQEIRKFQLDALFMDKIGEGLPTVPGEEGLSNTSLAGKFSDATSDLNKDISDRSNKVNDFFSLPENEDAKYINAAGAKVIFEFSYCEFNPDESSEIFSTLNMNSAEAAEQSISFNYESVNRYGEYPELQAELESSGNQDSWKNKLIVKSKQVAANAVQDAASYAKGKIGSLILGNVHGFSAGSIESAMAQGTIQSISSEIGQAVSSLNKSDSSLSGKQNAHR